MCSCLLAASISHFLRAAINFMFLFHQNSSLLILSLAQSSSFSISAILTTVGIVTVKL